jgi:hypothetical protein
MLEIATFILIGGGVTGYWETKNLVYASVMGVGIVFGLIILISGIIKGKFKGGIKKVMIWIVTTILVVIFLKTIQMLAISLATSSNNRVSSDTWFNLISTLVGAAVGSGLAVWGALYIQKKADEDAENRIIRENTIIVYFDLYLGLNDLKKLYIGCKIDDKSNMPIRMYFSNEWIKNVAMLEKYLRENISEVYLLYGELLTIADLLESSIDSDDAIISLGDKVFNKENFIDPLNIANKTRDKTKWNVIKKADLDITSFLNDDYRIILEKLNVLRTIGIESTNAKNQ